VPRVILCDRCGRSTMEDAGRTKIWPKKCRWSRFEVEGRFDSWPDAVYLCGECSRAFKAWMKRKEAE